MADYTQETRLIKLETALGTDTLMVSRFNGVEAVSQLFRFDLDLVATDGAIDPAAVLRKPALIRVKLANEEERVIHGRMSRFTMVGRKEDLYLYQAQVVPWTWFLTLRRNSRMYQNLSIIDIATKLFKEHDFSDFEFRCGTRPQREYVIQYNESDFDFVSRWLEAEGIFYYFEHTESKHTLVLADSNGTLKPCPEYDTAQISAKPLINEDSVLTAGREQSIQVGKITLKDWDYLQPSLTLESTLEGDGNEEIFEYPANFDNPGDGDRYARYRLEAEEARREQVNGTGNCRWMVSGHKFTLRGHFNDAFNGEYIITSVTHSCQAGGFRAGEQGTLDYYNTFTCIPASVPYRPLRKTKRPVVRGLQTAIVVGPKGEEIWTDKYGRVKVQFHWDREGKKDENSSCWIRVAMIWAGKNWGAVHIPRIGHEVIVDFLEGDPDRPIITGRVYNAEQMPPYELPANMTQSGIKSRSTKGGSGENFNEIRFEDLKGQELLSIHAEKNQSIVVENDETISVGHDQSVSVGNNRTESVGKDETISIGGGRTESVGKNETISISESRSETVGKDETVTIGKDQAVTIGGKETHDVGDKRTTQVGKDDTLQVGKKLSVTAGDEILLKTGSASIQMKKDGTIVIIGKDIKIEASGKIAAKASSDITMKGSQIKQN